MNYDVILFDDCSTGFSPRIAQDKGLGGVEWTLMLLAEALAGEGLRVLVLSRLDGSWRQGSVEYGHIARAFEEKLSCQALVVSRWSRVPPIEHKRLAFSLHDIPERWMFAHQRRWLGEGAEAVCVSSWLADKVRALDADSTHYRRSGVWSCHVIAPMLLDECYESGARDPDVFVYASAAVKGLPETIDTYALIRDHFPEVRTTRLLVATNGYDKPSAAETERMQKLGIEWIGQLTGRGVIAALRGAGGLFYVNSFPETHCLHPDTRVSIPGDHRGGPPTARIADLVGKSGFPVWAYDTAANRFKIATCSRVWQSKIADEMVALDLDSGATLRVTPDHLVMTYDREWVAAGDIHPGQRLLALNYRYNVAIQDGDGRWRDEHRLVGEWMAGRTLRSDEHVDHTDPIRLDNRPEMLTVMSQADHFRKTHAGKMISGPHRRLSGAASHARMQAKTAAERIEFASQGGAAAHARRELMTPQERAAFEARRVAKWRATIAERMKDPAYAARRAERLSANIQAAQAEHRRLLAEDPTYLETKRAAAAHARAHRGPRNHRVVAVRRIAGGPVYDMEVEGLHNFIAEEIVVHNCIIASTAFALGARCHVLTLADPGALPETLAGCSLLTRDAGEFVERFVEAYRHPDEWTVPSGRVPDRRASALLPRWKEVLLA